MTVSESIVIKVEEWELERLSCFVTFLNLVIALIKRKKKKKSHMWGGGGYLGWEVGEDYGGTVTSPCQHPMNGILI